MTAKLGKILLVGETILNVTYRADSPKKKREWITPYASFNEELLYAPDVPSVTFQGILYIAEFLASSAPSPSNLPIVCTGLDKEDQTHPVVESVMSKYDQPPSTFHFQPPYSAPRVLRILRRATTGRSGSRDQSYRPQLRVDKVSDGPSDLRRLWKRGLKGFGRNDVCFVRSVTPNFLGKNPEKVVEFLNDLQSELQSKEIQLVLDVRPIPQNLEILDERTIISSTLSRLEQLLDVKPGTKSHREVVEKAFWRMAPALALHSFSELDRPDSAILCVRQPGVPNAAALYAARITRKSKLEEFSDAGLVVGGDAFVSAFVDRVRRGGIQSPKQAKAALGRASAALEIAMKQRLGQAVDPDNIRPKRVAEIPGIQKKGAFETVIANVSKGKNPFWNKTGVVAPQGGSLRKELNKLAKVVRNWKSHPGRDLIAILGESRAGKEFPLTEVLLKASPKTGRCDSDILGPINMHQFLADIESISKRLYDLRNRPSVLILDEIIEGEAARSLLNLTAEKRYWDYLERDEERAKIKFSNCMIILLTSAKREQILRDIRSRIGCFIEIPPLRDRQVEIPYIIPMSLAKGLPEWQPPKVLKVSYRFMAALLIHDYRARSFLSEEKGRPTGLGQQNFRALEDMLAFAYHRSRELSHTKAVNVLKLQFRHLPEFIQNTCRNPASDGEFFVYSSSNFIEDKKFKPVHAEKIELI